LAPGPCPTPEELAALTAALDSASARAAEAVDAVAKQKGRPGGWSTGAAKGARR